MEISTHATHASFLSKLIETPDNTLTVYIDTIIQKVQC